MLRRCQFIKVVNINYDDERRLTIIDEHVLHFGFNQYTILSLLLARQEVEDNAFSRALYRQEADASHRKLIARDISRLRCRLKMYGLDIKRVYDQGYRLVSVVKMMV